MPSDSGQRPRRSRAVHLLREIVDSCNVAPSRIARRLDVTDEVLQAFISGDRDMPLDRQLTLAKFIIAEVPTRAGQGHNLLGQLKAAKAYKEQRTATHLTTP